VNGGSSYVFLAKLDPNGNTLFIKTIAYDDAFYTSALATDANGGIYLGGYFRGVVDVDPSAGIFNLTSAGNSDGYIVKYTASGILQWGRGIGGANADRVDALCTDGSFVYAGGAFNGTVNFGAVSLTSFGATDMFVAKYNASIGSNTGQWAIKAGATGSTETVRALSMNSSGGILLAGTFQGTIAVGSFSLVTAGSTDGCIAFISPAGVVDNAYRIGGPSSDVIMDIVGDNTGGFAIGGYFSNTISIGLATATSLSATDFIDGFVVKYNSSLNVAWSSVLGGDGVDMISNLAIDDDRAVYFGGTFDGLSTGFPEMKVNNRGQVSSEDVVNGKLNAAGKIQWLHAAASFSRDYFNALAVSGDGKLLYSACDMPTENYISFQGKRVSGQRTYIARYEE
jgi:hypothetical protein